MRQITDLVVLHRCENPADFHSYNIGVLRDGSRHYFTPFTDKAAHALAYNSRSVGVFIFGDFATAERGRNHVPTEEQYQEVARVIRELDWWYGRKLKVLGHSDLGAAGTAFPEKLCEGFTCPGENWSMEYLFRCIKLLEDTK